MRGKEEENYRQKGKKRIKGEEGGGERRGFFLLELKILIFYLWGFSPMKLSKNN